MPAVPPRPIVGHPDANLTAAQTEARTVSTQPTRSLKGWNAMTSALAGDIPTALRRARKLRQAALRRLP